MIYDLIPGNDPRLHRRAVSIKRVTKETQAVFDRLISTMDENAGIGLAAPQVGIMERLCVVRLDDSRPLFMANPHFFCLSDDMIAGEEGCLSFPDAVVRVERHAIISVRYLDYHGHRRECTTDGLGAVCIQHELDHLDGVTFHMRALKQEGLDEA